MRNPVRSTCVAYVYQTIHIKLTLSLQCYNVAFIQIYHWLKSLTISNKTKCIHCAQYLKSNVNKIWEISLNA